MSEGLRYNQGKTRHDLVPSFAQEQYAKVLTKGAEKYAERNWEKGMPWSKVLASLERHLQKVKSGEDYDEETGLLHSAHIMCNAAFLTEYYKIYPQGDDRPHNYLDSPRIGLDIDEVICDWIGGWVESKDLPKDWHFDYNLRNELNSMGKKELNEFYLNLKPLVSEIPFTPHCYITSRPIDSEITMMWLQDNGFPTRPVYTVGLGKSKVDIAKEQKLDIFVDDAYHNFLELTKAGIFCYLKDATHNQKYDVGFRRIKSLKEINA